ncbi:MAG: hypothetical protein JWO33_830 [Caulobacteraceae bacterium]|nr:hypothetical protein [Caulobacteraceae bacterium]
MFMRKNKNLANLVRDRQRGARQNSPGRNRVRAAALAYCMVNG